MPVSQMAKTATPTRQSSNAAKHGGRRGSVPARSQPAQRHPKSIAPKRPQAPQTNQSRHLSPFPYPVETKLLAGLHFDTAKCQRANYPDLARACTLLQEVETDLWQNALAPVALAHRSTAISLPPSGRILDILGKSLITGHSH